MNTRYSWLQYVLSSIVAIIVVAVGMTQLGGQHQTSDDPRDVGAPEGFTHIFMRTYSHEQAIWQLAVGTNKIGGEISVSQGPYFEKGTFPPPERIRAPLSPEVLQELDALRERWCAQPPVFVDDGTVVRVHAIGIQCPDAFNGASFLVPDAELPPVLADLLAIPESP